MAETVDSTLLLELLKDIRKEQRDQRTLLLLSVEHSRRIERRFDNLDRRIDEMDARRAV